MKHSDQYNRPAAGECIACRAKALQAFLSLGDISLANRLITREQLEEHEPSYPLDLHLCRACGWVQVQSLNALGIAPESLYHTYRYMPSTSETNVRYMDGLAQRWIDRLGLDHRHLVVEVGSNDGSQLEAFTRRGVRVLGVDPAANLCRLAEERGVRAEVDYFTTAVAARIRAEHGPAAVILCRNTFHMIESLPDCVAGMQRLLADDGAVVIEVPYLVEMLQKKSFDIIYHEHLSYIGIAPLQRLMQRHGLELFDVERNELQGGSIVACAQQKNSPRAARPIVAAMIADEQALGMDELAVYDAFAERVRTERYALRDLLRQLKRQGKRAVGYGAAAKGHVQLDYGQIGPDLLEYVVDRNPLKQGLLTPGTHIPVVAPEVLERDRPDYVVILTWNLAQEIREQLVHHRAAGGKFIVPLPQPTVT